MRIEFWYRERRFIVFEGAGVALGNIALASGAWYVKVEGDTNNYELGAVDSRETEEHVKARVRRWFDTTFNYPRVHAGDTSLAIPNPERPVFPIEFQHDGHKLSLYKGHSGVFDGGDSGIDGLLQYTVDDAAPLYDAGHVHTGQPRSELVAMAIKHYDGHVRDR